MRLGNRNFVGKRKLLVHLNVLVTFIVLTTDKTSALYEELTPGLSIPPLSKSCDIGLKLLSEDELMTEDETKCIIWLAYSHCRFSLQEPCVEKLLVIVCCLSSPLSPLAGHQLWLWSSWDFGDICCSYSSNKRFRVQFPAGVVTLGEFLYTNCLCWPSINWVPGCQTIGVSHSGDMETLWRGGSFHTFKGPLSLW